MSGFFESRGGRPSRFGVLAGGSLFVAGAAVLFSSLINLWPAVDRTGDAAQRATDVGLALGLLDVSATKATALILLALTMGALGGYIHAATSFATYLGNRQFKASWAWWYALRLPIGASLALLLYFAVRGGLLGAGSGTGSVDPYGVALVSGLAGLFSKQATDKLEEVFNTAFKVEDGDKRDDKLEPGAPTITAVELDGDDLTVRGARFGAGATIEVDDHEVKTRKAGRKLVGENISPSVLTPGKHQITVVTAEGRESAPAEITVN